jgi:ADP-heptose:LPS heptosyltransferase
MASTPNDGFGGVRRLLIFRLGSLGDMIVALPSLRLIARRFPDAERRLLTVWPVSDKAAPVEALLGPTGLVQGVMRYPVGLRDPRALLDLARRIRAYRPDLLIYLAEPRGRFSVPRDLLFFRLCGIRRIVGAPLGALRDNRALPDELWESEAARLARCLAPLGDAELERPESWDLALTEAEHRAAGAALAGWPGAGDFIALSIGTKFETNDWGDARWRAALGAIGGTHPALGLVTLGVAGEAARSRAVAAAWPGPRLDLCGKLPVRESAAMLTRARLFLGHDSGPMHLAAAVGTPVAAVFSARNRPGIWFPHGAGHRLLYHPTPCFGCRLARCEAYQKVCITSIAPEAMAMAAEALLAEGRAVLTKPVLSPLGIEPER